MLTETAWMKSSAVAQRLGIATSTLKKWRTQKKGPKGWKRISSTVVMYRMSEVVKFEETWHGFKPINRLNSRSSGGRYVAV
jgi:transposase-like protein